MEKIRFDIAVIGAGHAGVEAALACARTGLQTALFTLSLDAIANMPCNPSIGGTGKGHLVFEIASQPQLCSRSMFKYGEGNGTPLQYSCL